MGRKRRKGGNCWIADDFDPHFQTRRSRKKRKKMTIRKAHMSHESWLSRKRRMSQEEWEELLSRQPLVGKLEEMLKNPDLIHVRQEILTLQKRLIDGHKLSRRSMTWYDKQISFLDQLRKNPLTMSEDDVRLLENAYRLGEKRKPSIHDDDPICQIVTCWKQRGWVTRESIRIVRKHLESRLSELVHPRYNDGDLVEFVSRVWDSGPMRDVRSVGLISGLPELMIVLGGTIIVYPVVNLSRNGELETVDRSRITLKRRHVQTTDTAPDRV